MDGTVGAADGRGDDADARADAAARFRSRYGADLAAGRDLPAEHYAPLFPEIAGDLPLLVAHLRDRRDPDVAVPPSEDVIARLLAPAPAGAAGAPREIGRGGMGIVFRVRDEPLGREVAMKFLAGDDGVLPESGRRGAGESAPTWAPGPSLRRFLREAHVTAQLTHPGVPPVHVLGVDHDRRVYFTMKYVRGRTLSEVFRLVAEGREGWTTTRALQVFLRVCETLAFAHSRGVIHRDLKPPNVMVGSFGEVYVMDWGLAKVVGRGAPADADRTLAGPLPGAPSEDASAAASLTVAGTVIGTPAYMPPEQAAGRHEDLDARADVYAIGAMLYEMLAGHAPYHDPAAASPHPLAVAAAVAEGPPPPLGVVAPRTPPELAAVVARAMARDPAARYPSAAELAEDLHRYLDGRVVRAYRTGPVVEFRKWVGRHRAEAAGAAAVVALTVLASVVIAVRESGARSLVEGERDAAIRARDDADRARREADAARVVAEAERRRAEGLSLAARSLSARPTDPTLALQLAVAAAERARGPDVDEALHGALASQREVRRLLGHDAYVMGVAWSPAGDHLVSWQAGRLVVVWDPDTGRPVRRLEAHDDVVGGAAFSPDGDRVLTWSRDGTARIATLDPASADVVLRGHAGVVGDATFDATGDRVLTASDDGTARLFDARDGRERLALRGHDGMVWSATFHPDGVRAVTCGADGTARIWDLATGAEIRSLAMHDGPPAPGATSPSPLATRIPPRRSTAFFAAGGEVLVTWSVAPQAEADRGFARAFRVADGALLGALEPPGSAASRRPILGGVGGDTICLARASRYASALRAVRLADLVEVHQVDGVPGEQAMAIDPAGRWIAGAALYDPVAVVLDFRTGARIARFPHTYAVTSIAFQPGGDLVATAACDQTVRIWRVVPEDTDSRAAGLRARMGGDGSLAFEYVLDAGRRVTGFRCVRVADGVELWSHAGDGELRDYSLSADPTVICMATVDVCDVRDAATGRPVARIEGPAWSGRETLRAWPAPGGHRVARVSPAGIEVFDTRTGRPLQDAPMGGAQSHHRGAWDAAGDRLVVANAGDRTATLWDVRTGSEIARFGGHTAHCVHAAITADGTRVATTAVDRSVRLWDAASGRLLAVNRTLAQEELELAWSPDGSLLLASGPATGIVLVDGTTAEIRARIPVEFHGVGQAWFHPGGARILSMATTGPLRTWYVDPLPVARGRLPCLMEPAVWREVGFGSATAFDAFEDAWLRAYPRPDRLAARALRDIDAGRTEAARPWVDLGRATRERHALPWYALACLHAARGEIDEGIRALQRIPGTEGDLPAPLSDDPRLAPLRADARFPAIAARLAPHR